MKTLLICVSIHHGNTEKIAKEIANVLEAKLAKPQELDVSTIAKYDLIGFGSGIYHSKHHKSLFKLLDKLSTQKNKKAFIFTTNGASKDYNEPLKDKLLEKGFNITGEFSCKGFDTWGQFKIIGGINKGRPNEHDLENARKFAEELKDKEE
jgi:flavodoxin